MLGQKIYDLNTYDRNSAIGAFEFIIEATPDALKISTERDGAGLIYSGPPHTLSGTISGQGHLGTVSLAQYDRNFLAALGNAVHCFFGNDPVNISTGNFVLEASDIEIPTRGLPLKFTRFYNSLDDTTGPLGKGWTHNYNTYLQFNR